MDLRPPALQRRGFLGTRMDPGCEANEGIQDAQSGREIPGPSRILVFGSVGPPHPTPLYTHPVSLAGLISGPTLPHLHPAALAVPWAPCQHELCPCSLAEAVFPFSLSSCSW